MPDNNYFLIRLLLKHKRTNITFFILSIIFSVILVFFVYEKEYTATVSILPSASSFSGGLGGQLGAISKLAGLDLGASEGQSQDMLMGILNSTTLLSRILDSNVDVPSDSGIFTKMKFLDFLEIEGGSHREVFEKALKKMREEVVYLNLDENNDILYLNITTVNPFVSAQVANKISKILNEYVTTKVQKEFRQKKKYLVSRLASIKDSLQLQEHNLKKFLENNTDPESPEFMVQQLKLKRALEVQSQLYIELRKQLEVFLANRFLNLSDLKILDTATPPFRKSRPKRALLLITFVMLFVFLQLGINWGFYYYKKVKIDLRNNIAAE